MQNSEKNILREWYSYLETVILATWCLCERTSKLINMFIYFVIVNQRPSSTVLFPCLMNFPWYHIIIFRNWQYDYYRLGAFKPKHIFYNPNQDFHFCATKLTLFSFPEHLKKYSIKTSATKTTIEAIKGHKEKNPIRKMCNKIYN